ncbi:MAG: hypothetical protein ACLS3U_08455 [Lachnospiraceae bacterium]
MFHFGKRIICAELILSAENISYRGPLSDIPLSEETILATRMVSTKTLSLARFIVVRLSSGRKADRYDPNGTPDFALLEEYTGIEPIDHAELTKRLTYYPVPALLSAAALLDLLYKHEHGKHKI